MARWFVAAKKADFEALGKQFQISPVIARIIRNRDIIGEEAIQKYLYGNQDDFYDGSLLKGLDQAVEILERKIAQGKSIRVIGDYDVDGICATSILKIGLLTLGAKVDTIIPHRIKDGYGLNEQLIQDAFVDGIDTLITCDNGIAAKNQFIYAKEKGLTCIITDHHEVPFEQDGEKKRYLLPQVDALVDPKQEDCQYPNKHICGAGIAWKLIEKMWERSEQKIDERSHREILELAAVATVCDVMVLLDENRILVKEGLASLQDAANPGLRALLKVHDLASAEVMAYHLGFVIGPCLNATGRLDTAVRALELLGCRDGREAVWKAAELKQLNESRKEMTKIQLEEAIRLVENSSWKEQSVLVVYLPDCHESLAGIIAGRLRERYYKPVFVLTDAEEGVKGSGRSIDGYHMYEEMTRCKEIFTKYGGHRLAAGLSLEKNRVDLFRQQINANCRLTTEELEEKIVIDVPMPLSYVTYGFLDELKLLEPFGMGNGKPIFGQRNIRFLSLRRMGKNQDMARFTVEDEGKNRFLLLLFTGLDGFVEDLEKKYKKEEVRAFLEEGKGNIYMNITYYPSINTFRGRRELQFILQNWS